MKMKKINILFLSSLFIFILSFSGYCEIVKVYHKVKRGETLIAIAKKYGTSVEKIKELNGLKTSLIKEGQKLVVKKIEKEENKNLSSNKESLTTSSGNYDTVYYVVKKGDNLSKISRKYDISVSSIKKENNLKSSKIIPGMQLKIRVPVEVPKIENIEPIIGTEQKDFYQVKKGDTLEEIAKKFSVLPEELKKYNLLRDNDFKEGQIIIIPQQEQLTSNPESQTNSETDIEKEQLTRAKILDIAFSYLNMPYKLGGNGEKCIDCSTLTRLVYEKIGFELPKTSYQQAKLGKEVTLNEALPGDLVFFRRGIGIGHVGIYIGNKLFIHASSSDRKVKIDSLENSYFKSHFVCLKRYIPFSSSVFGG